MPLPFNGVVIIRLWLTMFLSHDLLTKHVQKHLCFSFNSAIYKSADTGKGSQFAHKTQTHKAMAGSLKYQFDVKSRGRHVCVQSSQATLLGRVHYGLQRRLFYSRGSHTHKNKIFNILHYITKINRLINK